MIQFLAKRQKVKIQTLNLWFSKVDNWDVNLRDGFPKYGKPSIINFFILGVRFGAVFKFSQTFIKKTIWIIKKKNTS